MSTYTTLRGSRRIRTGPARDIYAIPHREAPDDRAIGVGTRCIDCGVGTLRWAEAGYVPWHRICDTCGSHWDARPVTYYRMGGHVVDSDGRHVVPTAHPTAYDIAADDCVPTHAQLLAAVEWQEQDGGGIEAVGTAQWYRRARIYR